MNSVFVVSIVFGLVSLIGAAFRHSLGPLKNFFDTLTTFLALAVLLTVAFTIGVQVWGIR
jgi:hypothetical protein